MGLRFCMVTTFYPPYHFGGDGICVHRLAEALARRGHQVDVVHSVDAYRLAHPAEPEIPFEHHPDVTVHRLASSRPGLAALAAQQLGRPGVYGRELRELLEDGGHDVIHYHNVSLMGGPGVLRLGSAVKLYTTHEYWLVCPTHVLFAFGEEACTERRCLRCTLAARRPPQLWRSTGWMERCTREVDRFLMPSRFALERHRADGLTGAMTVLPHFTPDPEPSRAPAADDDDPMFLFVGRLEKLKGVQDLLRLFADYREARLVIVGSGDYESELRAQAAGLDHVHFAGHVHPAELGGLYARSLAVLVPSLCYEVFNLIPVEAFAHGTPALVRRLGAVPELVETSGAGFVWDTLEQCRDQMEQLRTDRALRDELGSRGRSAREQHWTEAIHMERYLGIVHELLGERETLRSRGEGARLP